MTSRISGRSGWRRWLEVGSLGVTLLVLVCPVRGGLAPGMRAVRDARWERQRQVEESVDRGDRLATPRGSVALHRLRGAVAMRLGGGVDRERLIERLTSSTGLLPGYQPADKGGPGMLVLEAPRDARGRLVSGAAAMEESWGMVRGVSGVAWAGPVWVDPARGLWRIPTGDLLVRLQAGVDAREYFGADWPAVERWPGMEFHYVLRRPEAEAEALLEEAGRRMRDPRVRWVEPDFWVQVVRTLTPNDPLFSSQWHLRGTNVAGVDAPTAWDATTGSTNVVVAILDDGVQLAHPDLSANIFVNAGETANGLDDDGNGYVDDVRGWDFLDADADANPVDALDNHGTSTAGVAAARGNNALGVAGTAYGCRILPIKILRGDAGTSNSRTAAAIRYAAGINDAGVQVWRGADVLSMSLGFVGSAVVDDAFADAARYGRGGRGCPIFVSSGNDASGWVLSGVTGFTSGTYTFKWQYVKDDSLSAGADTFWLDSVVFPGGATERFESTGFPAGWSSLGNAAWLSVQDGVNGNHALTGWNGPGSRAVRAGVITHNQLSAIQVRRAVGGGTLTYWIWVSSEADFDEFQLWVDNQLVDYYSGVPFVQTALDYPGTHPDTMAVGASTDFGYRADYSQYGTGSNGDRLDFLAPSSGGRMDVVATDRTGANGYNTSGDYAMDFGGTSASAPLAAGVGALLLARNPELTAGEVRSILRGTADRIGGVNYLNGWNTEYGYGRVNASRAMTQARPNLLVQQSASATQLGVGQTVTFSVTVTNQHLAVARSVQLTETPMAGLTLRSAGVSQGTWATNGSAVVFQMGDLPTGAQATATLLFEATAAGVGSNILSAVSSQPDGVTADDQVATVVTIVGTADLAVTQTVEPAAPVRDEPIRFRVAVANRGSSTAAGVVVTNRFSGGASFRSASVTQGTFTTGAGTVRADLGTLGPGAEAVVWVELASSVAGVVTNEAVGVLVPTDGNPANDRAVAQVVVVDRPGLSVVAAGPPLLLGWPTNSGVFVLESTPALVPPVVWSAAAGTPVVTGDRFTLELPATNATQFYRLRR